MSGRGYPKFRNDRAAAEIRIGVRELNCIGVSPPQDHPHVYINMGEQDVILCPYCATRFRFDPRLGPSEADPPDSLFVDPDLECPSLLISRTGEPRSTTCQERQWRKSRCSLGVSVRRHPDTPAPF